LRGYFFLKHMGVSDEKAFGLEKSDVEIEQIPLIYQPITNIKLDREKR
jgi:KUP system potassium uptake protein